MSNEIPKVVDETTIQQAEELVANLQKSALETELAEVKARAEKAEAENAQFKEKEAMELKRGEESLKKVAAMSTVTPTKTNAMNRPKTQTQMMAEKLACAIGIQSGDRAQSMQRLNELNEQELVDTKNSAGYVSTGSSLELPMKKGNGVNQYSIFDDALRLDISTDSSVRVPRMVVRIAELDYATSTSDINRQTFRNARPVIIYESADVSVLRTKTDLPRNELDNSTLERRASIIEPAITHFNRNIERKKMQTRLYNVDNLKIEPLIPTLDAQFQQQNLIVNVTDEALKATNGNDPYIVLHNIANSKQDKRGFFVRPLGFNSLDSTDFNIEKLINSIVHAKTLIEAEPANEGVRLKLLIGSQMYQKLSVQRSFEGVGGTGSTSNVIISNIQAIEERGIDVVLVPAMNESGSAIPCAMLVAMPNYYITERESVYNEFIETPGSITIDGNKVYPNERTLAGTNNVEEVYEVLNRQRIIGKVYMSTAAVLFTLAV